MKSIAILCLLSSGALAEPVKELLDKQVAAWNKKDLEGYMAGYWKSPELTFYSCSPPSAVGGGKEITRGWQATLERYRKRYQSDGKEMGKLSFDGLEIQNFGEAALARGRWHSC